MAIPRSFQGMALGSKPYATAAIQGTGVNPVHSFRGGEGRNTAPDGTALPVDPYLIDDPGNYGYMTEDVNLGWTAADLPSQTGMDDRPDWGTQDARGATLPGYPSYGETPTGSAKGEQIRAINKGADRTTIANVRPITNGDEGWLNKESGLVIEPGSGISDPIQYTMQTSMQQLRRTREGSQISGTASKQDAPVESRVTGQMIKTYVADDSMRHADMTPVTQHVSIRTFRNRTAGTGRRAEMLPNAMYMSQPLQRQAPGDPYQGATVPMSDDYGYTDEDWDTIL